ncbi:MAG: hypothetical protein PHR15_08995 [Atopobiaceae bacterium]|jgi:Tfp pilus assembly protein PilO|nr:hypothetical protein [Atopobiaceae bacterium]MCH4181026.1 hypothetical protein [Atopobiaceae bacterium]MCH4213769.1 hypothetical protein [Atopobiaceae bacterium]MCH4277055.1 hypothetical protein [Atopobiaceae bacterium]MCI1226975.1 hypothetical protein [Atopobiaceae bacterium]
MLTYTFSKREKVLIVLLALILIAMAWYELVFKGVQEQTSALEQQIADAQDTLTIDTAKVQQMTTMQKAVDSYEAAGSAASTTPKYDNIKNVMSTLDTALSGTASYSLSFDDLDTTQAGVVRRGVSVSFGCDTYDAAKAVISTLADGPYTCSVDSFTIATASSKKTSSTIGTGNTGSAAYSVSAHITYVESD